MKFSPFQLTRTYTPCMGVEHQAVKAPAAEEFTDHLSRAYDNLVKVHSCILTQTNQSHSDTLAYAVGDQVWLSTDNLHLPRASRKLSERWLGPYAIMKLVGSNAVELHLPCSMCIHPVVNISHVKPYHECLPGQPVTAPGPSNVMEDGEEEYQVEFIVDLCYKGKCLEYLVHWKGWSETDQTWEPMSHLEHAANAVHEFHTSHPSAPQRLQGVTISFLSAPQSPSSLPTRLPRTPSHTHRTPLTVLPRFPSPLGHLAVLVPPLFLSRHS